MSALYRRDLYQSSFNFENHPALFDQLVQKAQEGLESNPKDFKGLNKLNRSFLISECDFEYYYPQVTKVLNREIFQNRPESLNRLMPFAQSYQQKLEDVETSIALGKQPEEFKLILKELIKAHNKFQETFTSESQAPAPSEPPPIQNQPIYYPAFSYEGTPSLLPQVAEAAEHGLNLDPKDFKGLNRLIKYFRLSESYFDPYYFAAMRVLNGETFQDYPGSLGRLIPLAQSYQQKLEAAETAIAQKEQAEVLKPILKELILAHRQFRETFTFECEEANPYEPFTIHNRYPKTLKLYHRAFLEELFSISPELYAKWKEDAETFSGELLPIFHRLAILWLLDHPNALVPELFDQGQIAALRKDYQALKDKNALREALRGECEPLPETRDNFSRIKDSFLQALRRKPAPDIPDIFRRISGICSLQDPLMNGVARIIYGEMAKCFSLLDQIEVDEYPRDVQEQLRIVFLAVLKQSDCESLPHDLSGGEIEPLVRAFYKKYHELDENDRVQFERLFLKGTTDSRSMPVYHLLKDWQNIIFLWVGQNQFLLYRLTQISYHRRHKA